MKVQIRAVNLVIDRETQAEVTRVLQRSLERLERRVQRVGVRLVDRNGPRGGMEIACLVEVRLRPTGRLFVEVTDIDPVTAAHMAADKAAVAVTRALERRRELRRAPRVNSATPAHPSFS